jgi:hypothetical protein
MTSKYIIDKCVSKVDNPCSVIEQIDKKREKAKGTLKPTVNQP